MNRGILVFSMALALTTTVSALSQAPAVSNPAATEKLIVANERALKEAVAKADMKALYGQLAPGALAMDVTGINKISGPDFEKAVRALKIQSWNIDRSQFYWVNDDTVVHLHLWTIKGSYQGQPIPSPIWVSTVWTNKGGKWLAAVYQQTPSLEAFTPPKK